MFELLHPNRIPKGKIRAAVFDFDGTLSTLRCGWEDIMRPMMIEFIGGGKADDSLFHKVDDYIASSTGIQTVYQMRWLAEQVKEVGNDIPERDEWWYKEEYNNRLMQQVEARMERLSSGQAEPDDYRVKGSVAFLSMLRDNGIRLYLASGTDHQDVTREARVLGFLDFFDEIRGAPDHIAACSKEAVLKSLIEEKGLLGEELLVIGDGKVEIALGAACGAYTLGAATDERAGGISPIKRERLILAGADAVTGDFTCLLELAEWLNHERPSK